MPALATFGETMLRFSPASAERLETTDTLEVHSGGAESNVAIIASNPGIDAAWLSKLPANALGRRIARDHRANGVQAAVAWDSSATGRLGTYYLEHGQDPRTAEVIYDRADSSVTTATPADLELDLIREAAYFLTSGITPALSDTLRETTAELLDVANEAGTSTVFDLNYRSKLWSRGDAREVLNGLFSKIDVICGSESDVRHVLGYDGTVERMAEALRADYAADVVLVTRGPDGVVASDGEDRYEQPAYQVDTVDPIGSGDAFLAGFLAYRMRDHSVPAALDAGTATAALSRTTKGDWAVISSEDVSAVMDGEAGISR
ncbi:MAG: PfkB family carbohydrate kinase [Halobacteriales archaeon]